MFLRMSLIRVLSWIVTMFLRMSLIRVLSWIVTMFLRMSLIRVLSWIVTMFLRMSLIRVLSWIVTMFLRMSLIRVLSWIVTMFLRMSLTRVFVLDRHHVSQDVTNPCSSGPDNGECVCGSCRCKPDHFGEFCDICQDCGPLNCTKYEECVRCMFDDKVSC